MAMVYGSVFGEGGGVRLWNGGIVQSVVGCRCLSWPELNTAGQNWLGPRRVQSLTGAGKWLRRRL